MLTTTRREISNDYDVSQSRPMRNFAPDTVEREAANNSYNMARETYRPSDAYISRSEVAQRLFGQDFDADEYEMPTAEDYSAPDLMPSIETMQATKFANHQPYMRERQDVNTVVVNSSKPKEKFSARSKILIASYAAVLLALALIITLTTVSVASLFATSATEKIEYNQVERFAAIEETVDLADNADAVMQIANEDGQSVVVLF